MKILAQNKKARFNYEIIEEITAGIKLEGREIKSLRNQKPGFNGAFITINNEGVFVNALNIPRYKHDGSQNYNSTRRRLLLIKNTEKEYLQAKLNNKGFTIVPLAIGLDRQWAKIVIALVKGKNLRDKRQVIKTREENRRIGRLLKNYRS